MVLTPGTRLGSYEIVGAIGAGGMGEVYRARDTRLGREVAIKVLPALFATDPDRLARFEREAQVLASLNHPNIAAIYGVETSGQTIALVLELVEGRPLDALIAPGGMPLRDLLNIAIQMADALAAAHAAGVVHRDFKPGNVVVSAAGVAKVLDFGLAKTAALEPARTVTGAAPRTEAGAVMGTVAYMSPEQAAGRPLDWRSDIFSFGSVLFEMATGTRAFEGDTSMSTLAAIIHEPASPVTQVNARVPRELERLISRCHRKDAARRVQSMADLRLALEELRDDLESGRLSSGARVAAPLPHRRYRLAVVVGTVALAAAGAGALLGRALVPTSGPAFEPVTLQHVTADVGLTIDPAVPPNGSLVAYASDRHDGTNLDIWVQPAAGGDPVRISTHPADDREPAFAPDGSRIAFRSERDGGGIYVVPALGGTERLLVPDGRTPRFSPDGRWLAYWTGGRGGTTELYVMPAAGGTPARVFADLNLAGAAVWSPDSTQLLFEGRSGVDEVLYVAPLARASQAGSAATIDRRSLPAEPVTIEAWTGERVFFTQPWGSGASIWSVGFADGRFAGDVRLEYRAAGSIGRIAVEPGGRVHFASGTSRTTIWSAAVDDGGALRGEPSPVTMTSASDAYPSLSMDGSRLVFRSSRRADAGVWIKDLATGAEAALPSPSGLRSAVLSPDGTTVAYPGRDGELFVIDARGGVARAVCTGCVTFVWSWTSDGTGILANRRVGDAQQLVVVDVASGDVKPLMDAADRLWLARVSPDQRWLSFVHWQAADRTRLVVAPFTPGRTMDRAAWVSATEGRFVDEENAWSPNGRMLYFVSQRDGFRCIYGVGFDPAAGRVVGTPQGILHMHGTRRTILSTVTAPGRLDAAGGRVVFPVEELQGNIYSLVPRR
ncbi:MAG TPA: protein kinase [Vicinamibacterales bacterium]|nr:protein kinase [Vicinamibacterales bacterium]